MATQHQPHPHASKTNYVVEHAPPSAVCLVRKIQSSPYQALPLEQLLSVTVPNVFSLRPPPHVAHQAVMDFYFAVNGHCGVECYDPSSIELSGAGTPHAPGVPAVASAARTQQQLSGPALGAPVPRPTAAASSEDYRLSQIRRNERHVNNATYGKVCVFFQTREGCRRGPYCNFLHISKAGSGGPAAAQ
ncbi:hypothetical protein ERJ75_001321600 [Trypanosoma vivax]|nr:hypothetical protein ERJ75_001321600 [Trypanosoma vivax]